MGTLTDSSDPLPLSIGGPNFILRESLLYDVIPDRGQVVTSPVSVQWWIQGSNVNSLLHSRFKPFLFNQ